MPAAPEGHTPDVEHEEATTTIADSHDLIAGLKARLVSGQACIIHGAAPDHHRSHRRPAVLTDVGLGVAGGGAVLPVAAANGLASTQYQGTWLSTCNTMTCGHSPVLACARAQWNSPAHAMLPHLARVIKHARQLGAVRRHSRDAVPVVAVGEPSVQGAVRDKGRAGQNVGLAIGVCEQKLRQTRTQCQAGERAAQPMADRRPRACMRHACSARV